MTDIFWAIKGECGFYCGTALRRVGVKGYDRNTAAHTAAKSAIKQMSGEPPIEYKEQPAKAAKPKVAIRKARKGKTAAKLNSAATAPA